MYQVSVYRTIGPLVVWRGDSTIHGLQCYYTPRKLCLWEGILFSRCPKVRPTDRPTVCPKRFVSLITSRIIDGISSNFANTFIYTRQILLIKK